MRKHTQIVREFGAVALGRHLNAKGFELSLTAPQRWAERDSIPGEYWNALAEDGIATLEELALSADRRREPAFAFETDAPPP